MRHLTRSAVALRAIALVSTLLVTSFALGDAPAAVRTVTQVCAATVQQASPQSLSTSTECSFPVNWYEFALTDHQVTLQGVPPGWQVSYGQNGNQSLAFVSNPSAPTLPNSPFDVTAFFAPPESQFPLDHLRILASDDLGGTLFDVPINQFKVRGDFKKSHAGSITGWTDHSTDDPPGPRTFDTEAPLANGIELVYTPDETVSQCDEIAIIQVVTVVDDKGVVHPETDLGKDGPKNAAAKDAAATNGHTVDVGDSENTPYYQESPSTHKLTNGSLGASDGKGKGTPADVTDWPSKLKRHPGWRLLFEDWAVCIKGDNAGEVLAGITWELDGDGNAKIDNDSPDKPSQDFKDAVKSWEGKNPGFTEPGGGFKW